VKESELRRIFLKIRNFYSTFAYDDFKVTEWLKLLTDVTPEQAMDNLRRYSLNPANIFPPHPGILADAVVQQSGGPHIPNAEDTRRMLDEMDQQYQLPAGSIPDKFRKAVRNIGRSKPSTTGNGAAESTSTS
jgi:hypothetical protein